jgi:glyoxylate reductase
LGLIGGGRIGQAVARRAQGFGMRVLYADPVRLPAEREQAFGMVHADFDDVLREADFVSLHPQLTPQTRHLIGARELGLMKRSAFIVNTSRGPVIDEAALTQALKEGRIAGVGLDVYEHEPKVTPALVGMANVVLTPHLGSAVFELREGMAHVVVDNAIAIIEGRRPPNCLNPEVYSD